jgi:2-polyprenyl-6-methoxyphenol hydroxylase-like FAD-dependent oxidoreductase
MRKAGDQGMARKAIVSGGSIGGLFAANMLRNAGWDVTLLERTGVELTGRGAGIVTHDLLNALIVKAGATLDDLGVKVEKRVAFDLDGNAVRTIDYPQVVTSWDRVHSLQRALMPEGTYRLGVTVTGYRDFGDRVVVDTVEEGPLEADILVGADGFRSAVRATMLPEVQPRFAGYVVWRALAHEKDLPEDVRRDVFEHFGFFVPAGTQIIGYPIAGPGNDLRPGHRRYNFVWYAPVNGSGLDDMLTDASGTRHDLSIPPPLVRKEVLEQMQAFAAAHLPKPFLEILARSERPFFTPIYDHCSPIFAKGRVALSGDAACVARPHIGMGVTKAACDAEALARHLGEGDDVVASLQAYSDERVPQSRIAHEMAQELGRLIFDKPAGDENRDGRSNPDIEWIMAKTAVVP